MPEAIILWSNVNKSGEHRPEVDSKHQTYVLWFTYIQDRRNAMLTRCRIKRRKKKRTKETLKCWGLSGRKEIFAVRGKSEEHGDENLNQSPITEKIYRIIAISAKICVCVRQFIYRCWTMYKNNIISNKCREKFCKVKQKRPCLGVWEKLSSVSSFIPKYTWREDFTGGNFNGKKFNCVCVQCTACVSFMLDKPGLCSAGVRSVRRVWIQEKCTILTAWLTL